MVAAGPIPQRVRAGAAGDELDPLEAVGLASGGHGGVPQGDRNGSVRIADLVFISAEVVDVFATWDRTGENGCVFASGLDPITAGAGRDAERWNS